MRVALDGFPLLVPKTGIGHYTFELAKALAELSPNDVFELISPIPFEASVSNQVQQCSLTNLRLTTPQIKSRWRRWWAIGLPLYLRQHSFDIFHGTNYEVPLWNRQRNVLSIHDLSLLLHPEYHESRVIRRARYRLPVMIRSAATLVADSENIKQEILEHLKLKPARVVVVPLAARDIFHPVERPSTIPILERLGVNQDFVLTVGTMEPRKNLLTLAHALDQIHRTTSVQLQLVIAGKEGWLMEKFWEFLETSGIGERVRLVGYTSDEDLRALYSSCRLFVYPSLYEGFGLPPLEAMACGAPVITSRIPAIVETVGDAAVLIDPHSVEELATSIVQVWNDLNLRERLAEAGKKQAASFTWKRTANLTLGVYHQVLAARSRKERGQAALHKK